MADFRTPAATRRVSDVSVSLIRTWVPIGVGSVLAWVASSRHIAIPAHASAAVGAFVAAGCAAAYYALARALEHIGGPSTPARTARRVGTYMLGGLLSKPTYLTDAEYARLQSALRVGPGSDDHAVT